MSKSRKAASDSTCGEIRDEGVSDDGMSALGKVDETAELDAEESKSVSVGPIMRKKPNKCLRQVCHIFTLA